MKWFPIVLCLCGAANASPPTIESQTKLERIEPVTFAPQSAELKREASAELDKVVASLKADSDARVDLQGHAWSGERDPDALSQKRADAVLAYLAKHGIEKGRLVARGLGGEKVELRSRRVEYVLVPRGAVMPKSH